MAMEFLPQEDELDDDLNAVAASVLDGSYFTADRVPAPKKKPVRSPTTKELPSIQLGTPTSETPDPGLVKALQTAEGELTIDRPSVEPDEDFRSFFSNQGFKVTRTYGKAINRGSPHTFGGAADVSIRGKSNDEIFRLMESSLKKGYRVFDERVPAPGVKQTGPHIHVENGKTTLRKPSRFVDQGLSPEQIARLRELDDIRRGKKTAPRPASPIDLDAEVASIFKGIPGFDPETPAPGPVTETSVTLEAQRQAARDPQSTRVGVLYTDPATVPEIEVGEYDVRLSDGQVLRADATKLTQYLQSTGVRLADIQSGAVEFTDLIGGKAEPTGEQYGTQGRTAVISYDEDGNELVSSAITDPSNIPVEAALQAKQFPGKNIITTIGTAEDVVAARQPQAPAEEPPVESDGFEEANDWLASQGQPLLTREEFDKRLSTGFGSGAEVDSYQLRSGEQSDPVQQVAPRRPVNSSAPTPKQLGRTAEGVYRVISIPQTELRDAEDANQYASREALYAVAEELGISKDVAEQFLAKKGNNILQSPMTKHEVSLAQPGKSTKIYMNNSMAAEFAKFAGKDKEFVPNIEVAERDDVGKVSRAIDLQMNPRLLQSEEDAEAEVSARVKDKDYSAQQWATEILSNPLNIFLPALLYNTATKETVSDEWQQEEKKRLKEQHGSFKSAAAAEQYYRDMGWAETAVRMAGQTARSFSKNLVSGTGKSAAFLGQLFEDANVLNLALPDEAKIGLRNAVNVADAFVRVLTAPSLADAQKDIDWADSSDISKQQLFRAMQEFDKTVGDDPVLKGRLLGALSDGGGSALAFVALGAAMPSSLISTNFWGRTTNWGSGLAGALQMAGTGYEEAKRDKLDEGKARLYGAASAILGTTEMLGAGNELIQILKASKASSGMVPKLAAALAETATEIGKGIVREGKQELGQEVFQTTSGKVLLEYLKDNDPSTLQKLTNALNRLPKQLGSTIANEGLVGMLTGGLMGGATALAQQVAAKASGVEPSGIPVPVNPAILGDFSEKGRQEFFTAVDTELARLVKDGEITEEQAEQGKSRAREIANMSSAQAMAASVSDLLAIPNAQTAEVQQSQPQMGSDALATDKPVEVQGETVETNVGKPTPVVIPDTLGGGTETEAEPIPAQKLGPARRNRLVAGVKPAPAEGPTTVIGTDDVTYKIVEDRGDKGLLVEDPKGSVKLLYAKKFKPESLAAARESALKAVSFRGFAGENTIENALAAREQDPGSAVTGVFVYVAPTQKDANAWALKREDQGQGKAAIEEVDLDLKKTLDVTYAERAQIQKEIRQNVSREEFDRFLDDEEDANAEHTAFEILSRHFPDQVKKWLDDRGYDSVRLGGNVAIWNRKPIKSVTRTEAVPLKSVPSEFEHNGIKVGIEPMKGLDERLGSMQQQTIERVLANPQQAIDDYTNGILDDDGNPIGHKVFNADDAKTLYPEYNEDRIANVTGVHEASSIQAKLAMRTRLKELPAKSNILATAGGAAAGKTRAAGTEMTAADLVFDGTMKSAKGNEEVLNEMLENGHLPRIIFVYRDVEEAGRSNVERSIKHGRVVPGKVGGAGHYDAADTLINHTYQWAADRGIPVRIIHNVQGAKPSEISLDDLKRLVYTRTREETIKAFHDAGLAEYEQHKDKYDDRVPAALDGRSVPARGPRVQQADGRDGARVRRAATQVEPAGSRRGGGLEGQAEESGLKKVDPAEPSALGVFTGPKVSNKERSARRAVEIITKHMKGGMQTALKEATNSEIEAAFYRNALIDLDYWIKNYKNGYTSFYGDDVAKANKELQAWAKEAHGRELTDAEIDLFHLLGSLSASGVEPREDSALATIMLDHYLRTGTISAKDSMRFRPEFVGGEPTGRLAFEQDEATGKSVVGTGRYSTKVHPEPFGVLSRIIDHFNGDLAKAMKWINSSHPLAELQKVSGQSKLPTHEYLNPSKGGRGVFSLFTGSGAKLGSYYLNRVGDMSTVTKDMWYGRGEARYLGLPLLGKDGKAIGGPVEAKTAYGLRTRIAEDAAIARLAKTFKTEPAIIQQWLWDFEQRLWDHAGMPATRPSYISEGVTDGIERLERRAAVGDRSAATIGVGVVRQGTGKTIRDTAAKFTKKTYQEALATNERILKAFNVGTSGTQHKFTVLNLHDQQNTVGVWEGTSASMEESALYTVSGPSDPVKAFAVTASILAPNSQQAVMLDTYDRNGEGDETHITFKDLAAIDDFVANRDKYNAGNLSLNPTTKTVIIVHNKLDDSPLKLQELGNDYKESITNVENRAVETDFIDESRYRSSLQEARDSVQRHYPGKRGENISAILDEAEARLRKVKPELFEEAPLKRVPVAEAYPQLLDGEGKVDYEKVQDVAGRILRSEQAVYGDDPERQQGRAAGGRRNVEASVVVRTSESSIPPEQRPKYGEDTAPYEREIARQEAVLEDYAKQAGIWVDHAEFVKKHPKPDAAGGEALVYIDKDARTVTKLVNPRAKGISPFGRPQQYLDNRITLFNTIFPESAVTLEGMTRNSDGQFLFVIKQPLIEGAPPTSHAPIREMMKGKGFAVDGFQDQYRNEIYKVLDAGPQNAMVTKGGTVIMIDAIPRPDVEVTLKSVAPQTNALSDAEVIKTFREMSEFDIAPLLRKQFGDAVPMFHATTPEAAEQILKNGPTFNLKGDKKSWGSRNAFFLQIGESSYLDSGRSVLLRADVPVGTVESLVVDNDSVSTSPEQAAKALSLSLEEYEEKSSDARDLIESWLDTRSFMGMEFMVTDEFDEPGEEGSLLSSITLTRVVDQEQPLKSVAPLENSLGISRSEMPQIRREDQPEFIKFAKDRGVEIVKDSVRAGDLLPTQNEYNPEQAAQLPDSAFDKRLMVSSDNRVLDGHNTLVRLQERPDRQVDVWRIDLPATTALGLMKDFPKVGYKTVAEVGPTSTAVKEVRNDKGQLLAPNGKPSNLNEVQWKQVRTPEFKEWAGENWENVVKDENGEPKVLYHGTRADVDELRPSRGGEYGGGIYLTDDPATAAMFGGRESTENLATIAVYAQLANPLITNDRNIPRGAGVKGLQRRGYDGVIGTAPNGYERQWVVFEPTQIKSAIGNRGTFDPTDPSILRKAKTAESRQLRMELELADTDVVLERVNGGTIHENGELELNEADAEILRRLIAERHFQRTGEEIDELPFDGITWNSAYLRNLAQFGRTTGREQLKEAGFTEKQLEGYDALMTALDETATRNEGYAVAYVYEDALPHERTHKEERDAGGVPMPVMQQLLAMPIAQTQGTAFDRAYPGISAQDKVSELAAIIATGDAGIYGLSTDAAAQQEFLRVWANGIIDNNIDQINAIGMAAWSAQYPIVSGIALATRGEQNAKTNQNTESSTAGDQATASPGAVPGAGVQGTTGAAQDQAEAPASQATGSKQSEQGLSSDEEIAELTGRTVDEVKTQNRQFARSLASNLFDIGDVEYTPQTVKGWEDGAAETIEEKGLDGAMDEYRKMPAGSSEGRKTALGVAIAVELYTEGRTDDLVSFGIELTENIGNAAQELRASALLSRLSPAFASITGDKIVRKAKGRTMDTQERQAVDKLARELEEAADTHAFAQAALAEAKGLNEKFEARVAELEAELAEARRAPSGDNAANEKALADALALAEEYKRKLDAGETKVKGPKALKDLRVEIETERPDLVALLQAQFPGTVLKSVPTQKKVDPQTLTPEFKNWFKDSKVVDGDGKPLRVFRGQSGPETSQFTPGREGAIFFAATPAGAEIYGDPIYPVYLSLQHPLNLTEVDFGDEMLGDEAARLLNVPRDLLRTPQFGEEDAHLWEYVDEDVIGYLKREGFDGIVSNEDNNEIFVAFEPTQIKSAIGNSGAFDPNEGSILKSVALPEDVAIKPEVADALIKVAAAKLIDELPLGLTPDKFDKWLNEITNNTLGVREIAVIHAMAHEMTRPAYEPQDFVQKQLTKNRLAHKQRADRILIAEGLTDVTEEGIAEYKEAHKKQGPKKSEAQWGPKAGPKKPPPFIGRVTALGEDLGVDEQTIMMAVAQIAMPDEKRLRQIYNAQFPDGGAKGYAKAMNAGRQLVDMAKDQAAAEKWQEKAGADATKKQVLDLERSMNGLATEERLKRKALESQFKKLQETGKDKALGVISNIYNLPRSVMFSGDLGFLLAQGLPTLLMHPSAWWKAVTTGIPAALTDKRWEEAITKLYDAEMRKRLEASGTKFEQIGNVADFNDDFMSDVARHIPFVKQSNRAHSITTDLFRLYGGAADLMELDAMYEKGKLGKTPEENAFNYNRSKEFLAQKWVNVMSGKGYLGIFDSLGKAMAQVGSAPRYTVSSFQIPYYANPIRAAFLPKGARKIMMKNSAKLWIPIVALMVLLSKLGLINDDPEDKDFLVIDAGKLLGIEDMKINPMRALKEPIRLAVGLPAKMLYYQATGNAEGVARIAKSYYSAFIIDNYGGMGSFWKSKLHPTISTGTVIATGKNFVGEPAGWMDIAPLPLSIKETYQAARYDRTESILKSGADKGTIQDNWRRVLASLIGSSIGWGANSYPGSDTTIATKQLLSMMGPSSDDRSQLEKDQSQKANQIERLIRDGVDVSEIIQAALSSNQITKKQAEQLAATLADDLGDVEKRYGMKFTDEEKIVLMNNRKALKILDYLYSGTKIDWKKVDAGLKFSTPEENRLNGRAAQAAAEAIVLEAVLRSDRLTGSGVTTDDMIEMYKGLAPRMSVGDRDDFLNKLEKKARNSNKGGNLDPEELERVKEVMPYLDIVPRAKGTPGPVYKIQEIGSMQKALDNPTVKRWSTDDWVTVLQQPDLPKEDRALAETALRAKAERARKSKTLTQEEVDRIKAVMPGFNITADSSRGSSTTKKD